jgi:hypothetical protein
MTGTSVKADTTSTCQKELSKTLIGAACSQSGFNRMNINHAVRLSFVHAHSTPARLGARSECSLSPTLRSYIEWRVMAVSIIPYSLLHRLQTARRVLEHAKKCLKHAWLILLLTETLTIFFYSIKHTSVFTKHAENVFRSSDYMRGSS